jgi:hypothetical protein
VEIQLFVLFDVADLDDDARPLVEKVEQPVVELVNFFPEFLYP